jgi:acyl phosphate:glycerol-3-phosphate acyltransferase
VASSWRREVPVAVAARARVIALLLLVAAAYLIGSIPTGVLLARRHGVDPRDVGSGNIGATNVVRAAGWRAGALTLVGDAMKGIVTVVVASRLGYGDAALALVGLAAFIGHLYSCFLGFDGGKGVATALGVFLGLAPSAAAVVLVIFGVTVVLWRYVSVASLIAAVALPFVLVALDYGRPTVVSGLVIAALVVLRHRDNIRRLRFGTEPRFRVRTASRVDSGIA